MRRPEAKASDAGEDVEDADEATYVSFAFGLCVVRLSVCLDCLDNLLLLCAQDASQGTGLVQRVPCAEAATLLSVRLSPLVQHTAHRVMQ